MTKTAALLLTMGLLCAYCGKAEPPSEKPLGSADTVQQTAPDEKPPAPGIELKASDVKVPLNKLASRICGAGVSDWCDVAADDPCGAHKDVDACKKDARCEGLPYRGESVVACIAEARCFSSNCPTVGCISRCETKDEAACKADTGCAGAGHEICRDASERRCKWSGGTCQRARPC
jgi:hypothetical protein